MIYALLVENQGLPDCLAIATAIQDRDSATTQRWVNLGVITHVMEALQTNHPGPFYCLYCRGTLRLTDARAPRGLTAAGFWHFQHVNFKDCVGQTRSPPVPHALSIENPAKHGCYILLGCETTPLRNRRDCQTIVNGRTYCHLAKTMTPPCV